MSSSNATFHQNLFERLKSLPLEQARAIRSNMDVLLKWRPGRKDAAELALIIGTLPLYYLVRGITNHGTHVNEAVARGVHIIHIEQSLHIFWEARMQGWILSSSFLTTFFNGFYLYGHLPIIGSLAIWMYFWHRPQYLMMRNAFLLSGAIALIFFVNWPTAPPRMLGDFGYHFGFVDTILDQYHTGRPDTPSWFVNEYAAFPSMHIGWNMLVGISIWLATKNWFMRAFAVIMPVLMAMTIILTANHYFLDVIGGVTVMLVGLGIAVGGRALVLRVISPDSKVAREKGWVPWLYWLCGIPDTVLSGGRSTAQPA